jgi:hypothetical protein
VVEVFGTKRPYDQGSQEMSARDILAAAADRAEAELGADPDLQAALFRSLGQATVGIGRYADAAPLLTRSLEHHARTRPGSAEHAAGLEAIGWAEFLLGQRAEAIAHLDQAVAHFNEALELSRRLEGPSGPGVIASLGGDGQDRRRSRRAAPGGVAGPPGRRGQPGRLRAGAPRNGGEPTQPGLHPGRPSQVPGLAEAIPLREREVTLGRRVHVVEADAKWTELERARATVAPG